MTDPPFHTINSHNLRKETMTSYRHYEWTRLTGAPVEIRKHGEVIRTGTVDDAMPDSSMIWIASDEQSARALYEASEGFQVWVEPKQLEGTVTYRMTKKAIHG
ncbi:UNVERIFIED_ORG: hypothetical protein J2X79_003702 [Arthrobacter globiformis]|nr:hypothetical protein [Arthrobacter globiformis]